MVYPSGCLWVVGASVVRGWRGRSLRVHSSTVELLSRQSPELVELALRAFELLLLKEVGVLPDLSLLTTNLAPVQPERYYTLSSAGGLFERSDPGTEGLPGHVCLALAAALHERAGEQAFAALMQACAGALLALKAQLRALLLHHGGAQVFRTRALMRQLATV